MNKAALGILRRWGAIASLRLASIVLRVATKLYRRRTISRSELRAALTAARLLERSGALFVMGRRRSTAPKLFEKDEADDRIN